MSRSASPVKTPAKVFVGNLSFSVTEDTLKDLLKPYAPTEVQLKTRRVYNRKEKTATQRSLGFGFATFASEQAALKCVQALNDKVQDERPLKVELARPEEPRPPKEAKKETAETSEDAGDENANGAAGERRPRRRPRRKSTKKPEGGEESTNEATQNGAKSAPRKPKPSLENATPSKTQIFVYNLPYAVDAAQLKEFFTSKQYTVTDAVVATRRFRGQERSKGFGFVTFATEAEQKKAVSELNGKEIEGREVTIKVAMEKQEQEQEEAAQQ